MTSEHELTLLLAVPFYLAIAAPGLLAFAGALMKRHVGGVIGLAMGYFGGVVTVFWFVAQMDRCRVGSCRPNAPIPLTDLIAGLAHWVAGAYAVSWPWHLAWIGFGLICLGAGLWVRQRRDAQRGQA